MHSASGTVPRIDGPFTISGSPAKLATWQNGYTTTIIPWKHLSHVTKLPGCHGYYHQIWKAWSLLTFTCNPKSQEITENLPPVIHAENRPDLQLVAWVFKTHLQELLTGIKQRQVLGKPLATANTIAFQKSGLPHCHMLIVLNQQSKLKDSLDIDSIICAEVIDEDHDPHLYQIIKSCMIHDPFCVLNPCSVCMSALKCFLRMLAKKNLQWLPTIHAGTVTMGIPYR